MGYWSTFFFCDGLPDRGKAEWVGYARRDRCAPARKGLGLISRESLVALVEPLLAQRGLELVEFQLVPGRRSILRLFIDRDEGVNIGDCAEVSRAIARELDALQPPVDGYVLEVSSPGMHRPVRTLEQFKRFRGEQLRVELHEPQDGQTSFQGRIESVEGDGVRLRMSDGRLLEVALDAIRSAHVDIDPWKGRRKE